MWKRSRSSRQATSPQGQHADAAELIFGWGLGQSKQPAIVANVKFLESVEPSKLVCLILQTKSMVVNKLDMLLIGIQMPHIFFFFSSSFQHLSTRHRYIKIKMLKTMVAQRHLRHIFELDDHIILPCVRMSTGGAAKGCT
jgi:hypothetical protein